MTERGGAARLQALPLIALLVSISPAARAQGPSPPAHGAHAAPSQSQGVVDDRLPADEAHAAQALKNSPRHGEWVEIPVLGTAERLRSFVVYPERPNKGPVVIVVHEIFGLTEWVRSVADQLALEGFIAIAPDFLSGKGPSGGGTDSLGAKAREVNSGLQASEVLARVAAAREYGTRIPSANGKTAVVGFCWGGQMAFAAALTPGLEAAVSYYGPMPSDDAAYARAATPILGLYGENDQRVNAGIPAAQARMKARGVLYDPHVLPGAGHGFLRQLDGQNGANLKAAREAWPLTLDFLRQRTE